MVKPPLKWTKAAKNLDYSTVAISTTHRPFSFNIKGPPESPLHGPLPLPYAQIVSSL